MIFIVKLSDYFGRLQVIEYSTRILCVSEIIQVKYGEKQK